MKTNDYLIAIGTAAYTYLFYQQNAGINFFIFDIIFIGILLYRNRQLLNEKIWLWSAALCVMSGLGILIHSSALAIISNVLCLLLVSAFSMNRKTSVLFSLAFSAFSVVVSFAYVIDRIFRPKAQSETSGSRRSYAIIPFLIAGALGVIFFMLYKNANPLFAANTQWINLQFINFSWLAFTLSGFLIVYGLYYHRTLAVVETWENGLPLNNGIVESESENRYQTERMSGILLFVLLNFMLLILNIGDVRSIYFGGGLPQGITNSDFVHDAVGTIIFSILMATVLIMFLYRKNFNLLKNSRLLKFLVLMWIGQTLLMLISTASRNQLYINSYDLTYKRIGVFVWLSLAAIGLAVMYYKIVKEKSNWYLIRSNVAIWISVLACASLLNWDLIITRYNLENKPVAQVDYEYLFELSDANIPHLIAISKSADFPLIDSVLNEKAHPINFRKELNYKVKHYLSDYSTDWQSSDLRDKKITDALKSY